MPKPPAEKSEALVVELTMQDSSKHNDKSKQKQSQTFDQEMVEAFASLFRGREDKYGWLRDEATANYIVLPNDKNPEPAPVTLDLYRYHLLGKRWLGIFPLVNDRCRFAAVDLDEENFKKALAFRDTLLEQFGLKAYIAKTKSKGYRIILFFIEPIIAEKIIRILNKVVGNPQAKIEVFPKQLMGTFETPGNFFNLPSFGARCSFLTGDNKPVPLDYVLDHVKFNTEEHLRRALEKIPKTEEDTASKEKPQKEAQEEQTEEDDKLAVEKLLENCAFIQHCSSDAVNLSETHWWSEGQILSFFGEPGRAKYHELSSPYHTDHSAYTEKETNDKFDAAIKAGIKGIAPHRCNTIQQTHGFDCPGDCLAKKMKIKSPAGLARVLVQREKSSKYLIEKTNAKGEVTSVTVDKKKLIEDLKREFNFMSVFGLVRDDILVYENGVYAFNGEKLIREECETRVPPPSLTTHICHEIRDRIAGTTFVDREKFNTEKYIVNLENGLLNVKTRELLPHTPAFLSTVRVPITYDPQAKCPTIQEFLGAILRPEDMKVILEFFGYILIPDYSIPVVLILLGAGSNGKTQLERLLGEFIGEQNYVSVSLQDLENNPFAVASLPGKLLNMQGDLSSQWLSGLGMLKQLSGQDPITANRKYRDPIKFFNVARLVFASNKPPQLPEDTLAVWRRILPINLPNTFQGEKDIKNYIDTILTPRELSGLLNLALEGLQTRNINASGAIRTTKSGSGWPAAITC